jgi:hypothetical protein
MLFCHMVNEASATPWQGSQKKHFLTLSGLSVSYGLRKAEPLAP